MRAEVVEPAPGVRVSILPDPAALHLIVKEVHQVARVYSLFDIAATLLAERKRCRAVFEVGGKHTAMFAGKTTDALFLTKEEAGEHLWKCEELRAKHLVEETVEVDPPAGNYVAVARCGISGEVLGPPNFHAYQSNLRRVHRERFASMPFDAYASRVRTERGEEAVNAWLETMKRQTRWRAVTAPDDGPWITDLAEARRALMAVAFDEEFEETRRAEVSAAIPGANLSPGLLVCLKLSGGHARKHPAMLIPAVCKMLESEHLPVFKRQGKLFTGPARPQPLPVDAVLAERPGRMVEWIRANRPAKLEGLWQAVLPEGGTAPPAEYAADLFWMLQQGHVLLYTDDTLVVQEHREPSAAEPAKKSAKKKKRRRAAGEPGNAAGDQPVEAGAVAEEKVAAADMPVEDETAVAAIGGDVEVSEVPDVTDVTDVTDAEAFAVEAAEVVEPGGDGGSEQPVDDGEDQKSVGG